MAEENNQENEKKSPLKLILMIVGGIVLLGAGIGVGILVGGGDDTDPSAEISKIIEKKENPEAEEKSDVHRPLFQKNNYLQCLVHLRNKWPYQHQICLYAVARSW